VGKPNQAVIIKKNNVTFVKQDSWNYMIINYLVKKACLIEKTKTNIII